MSALPIFVISFNRGAMLRRVIASYRRQTLPVRIIVHDNGSDEPGTLRTLDELERGGIRVHRCGPIHSADELDGVDQTVRDHFRWWRRRRTYAVTDCDVDLGVADPRALEVYATLLERFPEAECVGPMLRIRDIPTSYPLYNRVMNRHIEQFWRHAPEWTTVLGLPCAFQRAPIDTTFALHRAGSAFRRLKPGIRVYQPFEAQHLDWYPEHLDPAYRASSETAISHWNNAGQLAQFASEALAYGEFLSVETDAHGKLVVLRRTLAGGVPFGVVE